MKRCHHKWKWIHSAATLRKKQMEDPDLGPVLQWMNQETPPSNQEIAAASPETRHYWIQHGILKVKDGVLYRQFLRENGTWQCWQFIVKRSLQKEVMELNHNCPFSGHLGQKKTREKTLRGFYWNGIRVDVNLWVLHCFFFFFFFFK